MKPYVAIGKKLRPDERISVFGKFPGAGGLTAEHFLRTAREHTYAKANPHAPSQDPYNYPSWLIAQERLKLRPSTLETAISVSAKNAAVPHSQRTEPRLPLRELEVVTSQDTGIATTTTSPRS